MPFRLCNALAIFQQAINNALFSYLNKFCIAYLDNVLVYSTNLTNYKTYIC